MYPGETGHGANSAQSTRITLLRISQAQRCFFQAECRTLISFAHDIGSLGCHVAIWPLLYGPCDISIRWARTHAVVGHFFASTVAIMTTFKVSSKGDSLHAALHYLLQDLRDRTESALPRQVWGRMWETSDMSALRSWRSFQPIQPWLNLIITSQSRTPSYRLLDVTLAWLPITMRIVVLWLWKAAGSVSAHHLLVDDVESFTETKHQIASPKWRTCISRFLHLPIICKLV